MSREIAAAVIRKAVDNSGPYVSKVAPDINDEPAPPFCVVDMAQLRMPQPPLPLSYFGTCLPPANVTLFSAHGGVGKTTLSLMLTCSIATGTPFLGLPTRRAKVLFFSGEDPTRLVLHRLRKACTHLGLDVDEVARNVHVIDATEGNPTLYEEHRTLDGVRAGRTTRTYDALRTYIEQNDIDVVIIDNASDTFGGDEINRAMVRGFMRSLALLVRERGGAVLLLAHIDKASARGKATGTDTYSGSTAWHNTARSRLLLQRDDNGALTLEHQKNNLGPLQKPILIDWPENGMPTHREPLSSVVQHIADNNNLKAVLSLMHEFISRGEYIASEPNSRSNAHRLLGSQRGFPRNIKSWALFDLLRDAERDEMITRKVITTADRKRKSAWALTAKGCDLIGVPCEPMTQAPSEAPA